MVQTNARAARKAAEAAAAAAAAAPGKAQASAPVPGPVTTASEPAVAPPEPKPNDLGSFRRALEKKLREIDSLKRKRDEKGWRALEPTQRSKIEREAELRAQLDSMDADDGGDASATPSKSVPAPVGAPAAAVLGVDSPKFEVGSYLLVDGHRAKVRKLSDDGQVRVQFSDSGEKEWLQPASDTDAKRIGKAGAGDVRSKDAGGAAAAAAPSTVGAATMSSSPRAADSARAVAAAKAAAPPVATTTSAACTHCNRAGHVPRVCPYGLDDDEHMLLCASTAPAAPCFARTFVVPLRRASASFDVTDLRLGRVDVGLRCTSAALFRSQGLRQNARVVLCFAGDSEGGGGPLMLPSGAEERAAALASTRASARLVTVDGALVRDLRPDESNLAKRIRAVSDAEGAAAADAEATAARAACLRAFSSGTPAADDGPLGLWSRGERRGLASRAGDLLDALELSLAPQPLPASTAATLATARSAPVLLLLNAAGQFIGDLCQSLATDPAGPPSSVVVLLGDDRGLSEVEERRVRGLAAKAGAVVHTCSLGGETLFASHSIVIVHHYLDRVLHSCATRPPRTLARGGGGGGGGGGAKGGRGGGHAGEYGRGAGGKR